MVVESGTKACVALSTTESRFFHMTNGIIQGSKINPYFFSTFILLSWMADYQLTRLWCHIRSVLWSSISNADNLAIMFRLATPSYMMLKTGHAFLEDIFLELSSQKTIERPKHGFKCMPYEYLNEEVIFYVPEWNFLGHIITETLFDDVGIEREHGNLFVRENKVFC